MSTPTPTQTRGDAIVVFFSETGTTERVADSIATHLHADTHRIVPATAYTEADRDYSDPTSRSSVEQNDPASRPEIEADDLDLSRHDVVFLGYPLWWGKAPRVLATFLEHHDLGDATIVPFCTSGSSPIGASAEELKDLSTGTGQWLDGQRFGADTTPDAITTWVDGLNLDTSSTVDAGQATKGAAAFDFDTRSVRLNSGHDMPILGLGTYSLDDATCESSVAALLEAGGRLIDTASIYRTEECVGRAIRASGVPRDEVFVITKLYPNQFSDPDAAILEAQRKLDLGYIDMMLHHHPGSGDVEAYKAMERAVAAGTIRSIGLSNWYVEELTDFLPQITITPALVQNEIHPYYQENDVIPFIHDHGIVVQGWYPLGGRGHTRELLDDPVISQIADSHGVSSAQVILRWNLEKGVVVIPGSGNPDHVRENLDLFTFSLTDEDMTRINALDRGEKHDWY